jgi:hypothetical protein
MKTLASAVLLALLIKSCGNNPPAPTVPVDIHWQVATVPKDAAPVKGYNVYRKSHTANFWTEVAKGVQTTLYSEPVPAGTWDYEVTAFNSAGESQPSNILTLVVP